MDRFEEIAVGDRAELRHIVSHEDISKFVDLTGDDNKLHVDSDYASQTALKTPVVHGMLGASFISTVIGTKLPGDGALWFAQNLEFLAPVRVGDEIKVIAEVIKKNKSTKVIELRTDIFNQHDLKVTSGTAKVKVVERKMSLGRAKVSDVKNVAVVVGGTGGIGRVTCEKLAEDGFDVVVCYNKNIDLAMEITASIQSSGRKAIIAAGDITDPVQASDIIGRAVREFGTVSTLVNCTTAPVVQMKLENLRWEHFQRHIDISIKGLFNLVQVVLPIMEKEKYGNIISLITQAVERPSPEWAHYITAKAGLGGLSRTLATELAPKGIRVNMVSPGMTDTELIADIPEKARQLAAAHTPLRRIADPEDIAEVISFLASKKAGFITGETVRVNGGMVMI